MSSYGTEDQFNATTSLQGSRTLFLTPDGNEAVGLNSYLDASSNAIVGLILLQDINDPPNQLRTTVNNIGIEQNDASGNITINVSWDNLKNLKLATPALRLPATNNVYVVNDTYEANDNNLAKTRTATLSAVSATDPTLALEVLTSGEKATLTQDTLTYLDASGGTPVSASWASIIAGGATPSLSSVLAIGNSAGTFDIDMSGNDILNCSSITATGDLVLNPVGSIDTNGKTLNMTNGEIHNCPLIHSQNNQNITIEAKGTGDFIVETNNVERLRVNDNGSWTIATSTGSSGQVLTSAGAGSTPTWTTPSTSSSSIYFNIQNLSNEGSKRVYPITFPTTKTITTSTISVVLDSPPKYFPQKIQFGVKKNRRLLAVSTGAVQTISTRKVAYSDDGGYTWTYPASQPSLMNACYTCAFNGSTWVIGGLQSPFYGIIYYSTDNGITWNLSNLNGNTSPTYAGTIQKIIWTGSYFFAVGSTGGNPTPPPQPIGWKSTDGITWSVACEIATTGINNAYTCAYTGSRLVIAGATSSANYAYSDDDGATWVVPTNYFGNYITRLVWNGVNLIGLGGATRQSGLSRDCVNWFLPPVGLGVNFVSTQGGLATNGWTTLAGNPNSIPTALYICKDITGNNWTSTIPASPSANQPTAVNNPFWDGQKWLIGAYRNGGGIFYALEIVDYDINSFTPNWVGTTAPSSIDFNFYDFCLNDADVNIITIPVGSTTGTITIPSGSLTTSSLEFYIGVFNAGVNNISIRID